MTQLHIPEVALVALVGVTGSGKSTFAREQFRPSQVLSSDAFRAMVADDENDQSASPAAFDALHYVAGLRLRAGRLTVIDATNVQPFARTELVHLARAHDVLPVAIVLDVPVDECWRRTQQRPDRDFGRDVVQRQHRELRRSLAKLGREGFRHVHVLRGSDEIAAARVTLEKLYHDRRDLTGPFDIIGDVHGCRAELEQLLQQLGWVLSRDEAGRPVGARHPQGRTALFVGDLVDRGPDSPGVLRLVMGMVAAGTALCVAGNHEDKLLRKLRGRKVRVSHGLAETLEQLAAAPPEFAASVPAFLDSLISHYVLDGGRLVVAHAGLKEEYQGRASGRVRAFCLYGETTGETDEYGLPVRYPWAKDYRGAATVIYGHTPTLAPEWVNNTLCIDTGCVFGGALTALRYPSREIVSVPAAKVYYEPAKPLAAAPQRAPDSVSVSDVAGRRVIDTGQLRVTIEAERAAAALEVMGRFAIGPSELLWLPPTMAPCSSASIDGYLEHPADAIADFRRAGVERVVCQEKHMGSRAVTLVRRDGTGVTYTRTGRPFFAEAATGAALVARVAAAARAAGLFDALSSDWLLLDGELMPWSAKAIELIKEQYAGVAAAGLAALPAALDVLGQAQARDLDVADLAQRLRQRRDNVAAFAAAYRPYCWPTAGLDGVRLAPFAVLASAGAAHLDRDHAWHLDWADRLVAAEPELLAPTRRLVVDTESGTPAATQWWLELTATGAEGMVVKPYQGLGATQGGKLVQPGLKCRGREYLRITYGPDYTDEVELAQLRMRNLGRKRSLALREHALGLAALRRHAAGEPLWRVHEAVFAVLALETEPVDPRL